MMVNIYTDGACRGNPGPGGWAALLCFKDVEKEIKGAVFDTTNNQMELQAAIEGLKQLNRPCEVTLHTDSKYVKNGITEWLPNWKKKNWKTANGKPVKNQAFWQELDTLNAKHHVTWAWVKGHSGHPENERVDQLANDAIDELLTKG